MEEVEVSLMLKKNQLKRLMDGKAVRLPYNQLIVEKHQIMIHPMMADKIDKAIRKRKGVVISMTPKELEMSGEGLKELWQGIKKGAKFVKDKIIDSAEYQKYAKPLVRKAVEAGVKATKPYLGPVGDFAEKQVMQLGERTGAYGLKGMYGMGPKISKKDFYKPSSLASKGELPEIEDMIVPPKLQPIVPPVYYGAGLYKQKCCHCQSDMAGEGDMLVGMPEKLMKIRKKAKGRGFKAAGYGLRM